MEPISFILCNYNAPDYFRFCYESLRKNLSAQHEIVLLDDGSDDDTGRQWMRGIQDAGVVCLENPQNIGIAYSYNRAIEAATNELVCVLHTDMYVPPGFDTAMTRAMQDHDFICSFRAEPDLYTPSADKAVADFGHDIGSFDESGFLAWSTTNAQANAGRTTGATFFPWMTRRSFFVSIGGVDLLFLKYMVDDDDLYLRAKLAGARMCQVMDAAVYHFGSRSTRYAGDIISGAVPSDWEAQYERSQRNFVRKWGRHSSRFWTARMEIQTLPKYDIGIVARGAGADRLRHFEPWCSNIYVDDPAVRSAYVNDEGPKTMLNLAERVRLFGRGKPGNDIVLELAKVDDQALQLVQQLPSILDQVPGPGPYDLGSGATLKVHRLTHIEGLQGVNTRRFAYAKDVSEQDFSAR